MSSAIHRYIKFSKKEGIAAIIVAIIIVPLAFLPMFKKNVDSNTKVDAVDSTFVSEAANTYSEKETTNNEVRSAGSYRRNASYEKNTNATLFNFDPNTATQSELLMLGLRDKTVQTLCNYRAKGGKFKTADDLKKVYGLRSEEFERLKPFIVINGNQKNEKFRNENFPNENTNDASVSVSSPKYENKRKAIAIDINEADTTAFQSLYGIGSKLAARIVNYRNKLGGFYSIDQVGETYGVPDSTFQKIKPFLNLKENTIQKLNINSASYDALNAHPYISSKLAYLIMKYRKEKGNFTDIDAIKELAEQTNDSYEKIVNYLSF
jgi:competence ComEA-like helix-hairpin-helix protein